MSHFVFALDGGGYVGTRKNNGRMYESRPSASPALSEARVFNTRAAASRAGSALGENGHAHKVFICLEDDCGETE
jgi:hypothetical protein